MLVEPGNLPPAPGLCGNTLRQLFYTSIGGQRARVRFSNAFGRGPLTLSAVHVAPSLGRASIDGRCGVVLTFGGSGSVTIGPGDELVSDPFDLALEPLTQLAVTILFGDVPSDVTGHPGSRTNSYLARGNALAAGDLSAAMAVEHWYVVAGIDIVSETSPGAIVTIGDSITDGRGSTTDGNDRWPDCLSRRLRAYAPTREVAVLNAGIGGNHVLSGGLGPSVVQRFERDALQQRGARWLILFEGVNDIGTSSDPAVARELIGVFERLITLGHRHDFVVFGAPILPFEGSQYTGVDHEAARQAVNAWIRESGQFDAVIDLEAAVRDPNRPSALRSEYDCGDHLHLSPAGLQRLADAVDLELFCRSEPRQPAT